MAKKIKKNPKQLQWAAIWVGKKIQELDKRTMEKALLFLVDVISFVVLFAPNPILGIAAKALRPSLKELIDTIDGKENL